MAKSKPMKQKASSSSKDKASNSSQDNEKASHFSGSGMGSTSKNTSGK